MKQKEKQNIQEENNNQIKKEATSPDEANRKIRNSVFTSNKSQSNINDIQHFFSQKNTTPSTNIYWANQLRIPTDHDEIKKSIAKIPNRPPNAYLNDDEERKKYKSLDCPNDIEFQGNVAEFKHVLHNAPGYTSSKSSMDFISRLRDYKLSSKKLRKLRYDTEQNNGNDNQNILKNENQQNRADQTLKHVHLEKNWNSLPKIDNKHFNNFDISKSANIKDSIAHNNSIKYSFFNGYSPSYSVLPRYNEKFGEKNSVNFKHMKSSTNSQLQWIFHLRQYK